MKQFGQHDFARPIGNTKKKKTILPLLLFISLAAVSASIYVFWESVREVKKGDAAIEPPSVAEQYREKTQVAEKTEIKPQAVASQAPAEEEKLPASFSEVFLSRQDDPVLGSRALETLLSQNPFSGFYLMVDGKSGRILAWAQQQSFQKSSEPTFMADSTFPAASLSKIVTAAAALESRRYGNDTRIPLIGSSVTLYGRQLKVPDRYKGSTVSLEKAFASSINPSMALAGLSLGGQRLKNAADRLGFNRNFSSAVLQESIFDPPQSGFGLAEAASGFTTEIRISPLLAAAIVRSVLQESAPELPWSSSIGGEYAPSAAEKIPVEPFSSNTYYGLNRMFEATIENGSARSPFRDKRIFFPYNRKRLVVGGKTGTKDCDNYRYQWFAGFAKDRKDSDKSLVVVCLHINEISGTRANYPAKGAAMLMNHWAKNYLDW